MNVFYKIVLFLYLPVLVGIFLIHYIIVGQAIYGDGIFYYAYTHSLYMDHDLSFKNEFDHKYSYKSNNIKEEFLPNTFSEKSNTGFRANRQFIGAPLLWLPVFALADKTAKFVNFLGGGFSLNGYSDIYQLFVGIENICFVLAGIFLLFIFLKKLFSPFIAYIVVTTFLFGSNLLFYAGIDVINSHPASFLFTSFFLIYFWTTRSKITIRRFVILGTLLGITSLIRTNDSIYGIFLVFECIEKIYIHKKKNILKLLLLYTTSFFSALLVFIPQTIVWKILNGSYLESPYTQGYGFGFFPKHIIEVFLNSKNGILLWMPLVSLSLLGFVFLYKKKKIISIYTFIGFLLQYLLISLWSGWHQGEAFGIRMLISTFPFLSIGFAGLLQELKSYKVILSLCIFLIVNNMFSILYFLLFVQVSLK